MIALVAGDWVYVRLTRQRWHDAIGKLGEASPVVEVARVVYVSKTIVARLACGGPLVEVQRSDVLGPAPDPRSRLRRWLGAVKP